MLATALELSSHTDFAAEFSKMNWQQIGVQLDSVTTDDVESTLAKVKRGHKRNLQDFIRMISPAAEAYIKPMAQLSHQLTRQRFGNTMGMYIPLYLSNLCANDCSYCGFSMSNKLKRKTLSLEEIEAECLAIKKMGFDAVLIVTGEHETKVGMDYFRQALPIIKKHFSYLMLEVQPLSQPHYSELKQLGLDAVMVYQETYDQQAYDNHHIRGKKKDFDWRLDTPDRLGRAGIDKIGLGVLIGLSDWRIDSVYNAAHLLYLQKAYWKTRFSVSFPRLRPCSGGLTEQTLMTDKQLVQLISAYRLLDSELELSLSTRESAEFRDKLFQLGPTTVSAGSSTQPGGYVEEQSALEQFSIDDNRPAQAVAEALKQNGLQPVWSDWDGCYST